jgi:acetolactate synthase-1/2/3 large subunit
MRSAILIRLLICNCGNGNFVAFIIISFDDNENCLATRQEKQMKVTQSIIKAIETEGITHVFMVPGGLVDAFSIELSQSTTIKTVISAHEGGAIAMADGYARASGKFGVAMCISGPGIMNMTTGIYTAYMDKSPVLIISGEVPTVWEGRGGFQDTSPHGAVNDGEVMKNITAVSCRLENMTNFGFYIHSVFQKMLGSNSRGPAHLAIPANVQHAETDYLHTPISAKLCRARVLDNSACHGVPELIANHVKLAIVCGYGAHDVETSAALLEFAEKYFELSLKSNP